MSIFLRSIPLGQAVPPSPHAVCCSLPTVADIIAYERGDAAVRSVIRSGYPRFVVNAAVQAVADAASSELARPGSRFVPTISKRAARRLAKFIGLEESSVTSWMPRDSNLQEPNASSGTEQLPPRGESVEIFGVLLADEPEVAKRAKAFLQHTGLGLPSRVAAAALGYPVEEERAETDAEIFRVIGPLVAPAAPHLTACGMNAVHAALAAAAALQEPCGRHLFVQLGWLYLDTQEVLLKLLGPQVEVLVVPDVTDLDAIKDLFSGRGREIAAVITEVPTNPNLQVPDLATLSDLCAGCGALLIADPSLAGLVNLNVLPFADIVVTSLTKYSAHRGDVMMGLLAVNPDSPRFSEIEAAAADWMEPPSLPDRLRLAAQVRDMATVAKAVNANTSRLADWLKAQPRVARVRQPDRVAIAPYLRPGAGPGGILTIELVGSTADALAAFYDRAEVVKGPSFGTHFTMMCPFLYLAHFDLVSTLEGQAYLRERGLDPHLVRLSVGSESLEAIQAALQLGFNHRETRSV